MTLESDTLRFLFAESNRFAMKVEWNHIGSFLSSTHESDTVSLQNLCLEKAALFLKTVFEPFSKQEMKVDSSEEINMFFAIMKSFTRLMQIEIRLFKLFLKYFFLR